MRIRNWKRAVIFSLLFLAPIACSKKAPTIEIEQIPIAMAGGPSRMDTISGRVRGSRRGQRLVLYAKAGVWWIQPYAAQPFTTIGADGRWSTSTHLGTQYAALLVDPNYRPNDIENALPAVGNGVAAVATFEGRTSPAAVAEPLVSFSGYKWQVRDSVTDRNGSVQPFKTGNIRIDSSGFLHMMIVGAPPHWTCSEVMLTRSLGYGTYLFDVADPSQLEPAAVLSLFTWTDADPDQHHREMDINLTRWGDPVRKSAEYILQPYYLPQNVFRFTPPAGAAEYSMQWGPGLVSFRGRQLRDGIHSSFAEHNFSVGVPTPSNEAIHLNFCAFGYSKVPLQHSSEVVVERFQFLP